MSNRDRGNGFFSGLILGALLGVGFYYFLTATEEGKKVKKEIKKKSGEALDKLTNLIEEIEEKGEGFKKRAKQIQAELEARTQAVKKEIVEEAKGGLAQVDKLRERGRRATKRFFTRNGKPLS